MRKSRFTEEKMVKILRETDAKPVAQVAKKHGVSQQTLYQWKKRFGGMDANDAKRLKPQAARGREHEAQEAAGGSPARNRRDEGDQRKKVVGAPARRRQVALAHRRGIPLRRACALLGTARSGLRYQSKLDAKDAPILAEMRRLAAMYPRYGYRRVRIFLRRRGIELSHDRCYRLWKKAKLQVPKKRPRKRVASGRPRPNAPSTINQVWAYDFVFDATADGRQIKCLTVVDEWTRECLAIDVRSSIRSNRVIEVLSKLVSLRGAPRYLRSDNGPEFVSRAILEWITNAGIRTAHIDPGKPWQNGTNESFNDKFRTECLSLEWFRSRTEARGVIEAWRRHYNQIRPHSSIDGLTPSEFRRKYQPATSNRAEATFSSDMVL